MLEYNAALLSNVRLVRLHSYEVRCTFSDLEARDKGHALHGSQTSAALLVFFYGLDLFTHMTPLVPNKEG
jgi:hypothetical protein